jgi:acyl-homoserine-lactone acylase
MLMVRRFARRASLLTASWLLAAPLAAQTAAPTRRSAPVKATRPPYDARIRWTTYGIPHVTATSWESLGYGYAYATAEDAFCTIARDIVMVNGDLARHFGVGDGRTEFPVESDVFHRALLDSAAVARFASTQPDKAIHARLRRRLQPLVGRSREHLARRLS